MTVSYFTVQQLILLRSPLQLNRDIVTQFEQQLGLSFIEQEQTGRVCFANQNKDLQDAYKQVFYTADLLAYVQAFSTAETDHIPYPTDPLQFWKIVKIQQQNQP